MDVLHVHGLSLSDDDKKKSITMLAFNLKSKERELRLTSRFSKIPTRLRRVCLINKVGSYSL